MEAKSEVLQRSVVVRSSDVRRACHIGFQADASLINKREKLRCISGTDFRVKTLENGNRWTDNTRLVDTYRRGRVLLAGDRSHIHSPFGGQGMSFGLVEAANLGWKIAMVLRGEMPESLLDTYTAERRPVAEAVLANTFCPSAHNAARSTIGCDAGPRGEADGIRQRQSFDRPDD